MSGIVFESGRYSNHSSNRVIYEVNHVKNKRMKVYPLLLEYFENRGTLETLPTMLDSLLLKYDIHPNENDNRHLHSLLQYLALQPNILVFLRVYLRNYKILIEKAIGLVTLSSSVEQPYLRDLITGNGIHREDAEIIVDAYYWSNGKHSPKYVTIERQSIECNRETILHILKSSCTDFPATQLELLNIRELT